MSCRLIYTLYLFCGSHSQVLGLPPRHRPTPGSSKSQELRRSHQKMGWGFFGTCRSFSSPCQRASLVVVCRPPPPPPPRCGAEQGTKKSNVPFHGCLGSLQVWEGAKKAFVRLVVVCRPPPPPPRCGAEQGTKKSNAPFHGCLGSLQVWEGAKKAFVPGQVVFFRILEGLWQDSCTSRKNPISQAPGFFWGLGGLAQDTVRPVQGLHKASARTFAVCSRTKKAHQKPCQGLSPSFFIQVLKKAFWGEGKNITPLQGFFPRPAGNFSVPVRQRQSQNQSRWQRPEFEPEHRPIAASHGQSEVTEAGAGARRRTKAAEASARASAQSPQPET